MASQVDIYNLALTHLDISQTVQSVNDNTASAGACNRYYDFARKKVLEGAYWDFATKCAALALLLDQNTFSQPYQIKEPGWRYIYTRPNDCLRSLAVTTQFGLRTNPFMSYWWRAGAMDCTAASWGPFRPPWRESLDQVNTPTGQSVDILSDQDSAWLVYTTDVTNVNMMPFAFQDCLAWSLAEYIAGPLSASQSSKDRAIKMAIASMTTALAVNLNEKQSDPYPDSPAITARN